MDILSTILGVIGVLLIATGFIILAFKVHWIAGIITTGVIVLILAGILYETWLER